MFRWSLDEGRLSAVQALRKLLIDTLNGLGSVVQEGAQSFERLDEPGGVAVPVVEMGLEGSGRLSAEFGRELLETGSHRAEVVGRLVDLNLDGAGLVSQLLRGDKNLCRHQNSSWFEGSPAAAVA